MRLHWDIFCRVIDNYGDIGVCWRLARQLAAEHGLKVRLWVDDLQSLAAICPSLDCTLDNQDFAGVNIRLWHNESTFNAVPGEVVVEAFACDLPADYLAAMAKCDEKPRWVNLEYLTAEDWAESCHRLASPHPTLGLRKYFFFPGFLPSTGGLLRESHIAGELAEYRPFGNRPLEISLFCYDSVRITPWLNCVASGVQPVVCYVPPGKPRNAIREFLGNDDAWERGSLTLRPIDFLPMDDYDALLARCDLNFVRGEDSFVRAQWACHPFVWQIYAQEEAAHLVKLDAFLVRYLADAEPHVAMAVRAMFLAWNTGDALPEAWAAFIAVLPELSKHHANWRSALLKQTDLATSLVNFCSSEV